MNEFQQYPITLIIIAATALVSIPAFSDHNMKNKYMFYPYAMTNTSQYYRFITYGFIHADYMHLIFNMFTLYSFGSAAELILFNKAEYISLYVTALVASSLFDFFRNRHNSGYAAVGASGAVSAVLFATMIIEPWESGVSLMGIRGIFIPNIVFAILYLVYCMYMSKRGRDNIGHNAHFWGSVYGFAFAAITKPDLLQDFLYKLVHPTFIH